MGKSDDKHEEKEQKRIEDEDPCERKKRLEVEKAKAEKLAKQEEAQRLKEEKAAQKKAERERKRQERLAKSPIKERHQIGFLTRDTAIRYFGYAQEVGYALQGSLGYSVLHFLLIPAWAALTWTYIFRDAYEKAFQAKVFCPRPVPPAPQPSYLRDLFERLNIIQKRPVLVPPTRKYLESKARVNAFDALAWQSITSIIIPALLLRKARPWAQQKLCSMGISYNISQHAPTVATIALLPILSKPIDKTVDFLFDNTIRKAFPEAYKRNNYVERPPN